MITATPAALAHIQSLLKPGQSFYLRVKKTGCSGYRYQPELIDQKKQLSDIELHWGKITVFVDAESREILTGTEIDFVKKDLGIYQLVFHNPNAEDLCGCGESFSLKKKVGSNDQ